MDKAGSLLRIIGCKDFKIYMNSIWQREAISRRFPSARRCHLPAHNGHGLISMLKRELTCTCDTFYPLLGWITKCIKKAKAKYTTLILKKSWQKRSSNVYWLSGKGTLRSSCKMWILWIHLDVFTDDHLWFLVSLRCETSSALAVNCHHVLVFQASWAHNYLMELIMSYNWRASVKVSVSSERDRERKREREQ